ncbi:DUF2783 domain-containing protein [Noviherbaspirillum sp. Root189]|uniref:DUF2783 domain-containing protein n=1 Tax=Noviherbaspirillum sp. Root189 TaxID=1736487 RepID=UPI00070FCB55|nr:DUF2783 domain-containing protein [Noviherbaspirillum sp. Root189]KRB88921.1 hypothetical protein ASE07_01885 [Noviherbaspirillum sp. Root189]
MNTGMPTQDLEMIYDELALKIDQAGERSELLLAKLSLLLANQIGDKEIVLGMIGSAAKDL